MNGFKNAKKLIKTLNAGELKRAMTDTNEISNFQAFVDYDFREWIIADSERDMPDFTHRIFIFGGSKDGNPAIEII